MTDGTGVGMLRRKSGSGRRFAVGSVLLTTLAVAATGCSSGGSSRAASGASPSVRGTSSSSPAPTTPPAPTMTASTAASVPPAPTAGVPTSSSPVSQLTGSYLKTLLPRTADESMLGLGPPLPSGWSAVPGKEKDSGPATTAPAPSVVSADNCDPLVAEDLDLAGGLSVASATEPLGTDTAGGVVAFYAYKPGDAVKSLAQVRHNVTDECASFTAKPEFVDRDVTVNVSATPVPGLGDEALLIKTAPPGPYIAHENLLVRRGDLMLSLSSSNATGSLPDFSQVAFYLVHGLG